MDKAKVKTTVPTSYSYSLQSPVCMNDNRKIIVFHTTMADNLFATHVALNMRTISAIVYCTQLAYKKSTWCLLVERLPSSVFTLVSSLLRHLVS